MFQFFSCKATPTLTNVAREYPDATALNLEVLDWNVDAISMYGKLGAVEYDTPRSGYDRTWLRMKFPKAAYDALRRPLR